MMRVTLTEEEHGDLLSMIETFDVLSDVFNEGHGSPEAVRLAAAGARRAAVVLDGLADRIEAAA